MNKDFEVIYIPEPQLLFNKNKQAYNPCVGLIKYGPRFSGNKEVDYKEFKIGIIGSERSISQAKDLFELFQFKISPNKEIKPWRIPFPGLNKTSPLNFSFIFNPEWEGEITTNEMVYLKDKNKGKERNEELLNIIKERMEKIYHSESPPDMILISIPEELFTLFSTSGADKPNIKLEEDDFHNRVKILAMKLKMPTQLIRPETLKQVKTQELFLIAWNLVVGILYKCQKGHPWKLTYLEEDTCYVGISFFKEKGKQTRRASLAQIFLDTGESFVLRGDSFKWVNRKNPNSPHLSMESAEEIIKLVLKHYKSFRDGKNPNRLVIHKSSGYWEEELDGFLKASKDIKKKDFVTILDSDIKFFTSNKYPILRGTLIKGKKNNFLYTTGFVPTLGTYPGITTPRPLSIEPYHLDSDIKKVCEEILSFTKLDWNNTFVYSKLPVTISVSRKVGSIMAETVAQNIEELDPHYFYYM